MSIRLMTRVWDSGPDRQAELLVLLALADFADDSGVCWPAMGLVAHRARMSERNLRRVLQKLGQEGYVETDIKRGRNGTNRFKLRFDRGDPSPDPVASGGPDKPCPGPGKPDGLSGFSDPEMPPNTEISPPEDGETHGQHPDTAMSGSNGQEKQLEPDTVVSGSDPSAQVEKPDNLSGYARAQPDIAVSAQPDIAVSAKPSEPSEEEREGARARNSVLELLDRLHGVVLELGHDQRLPGWLDASARLVVGRWVQDLDLTANEIEDVLRTQTEIWLKSGGSVPRTPQALSAAIERYVRAKSPPARPAKRRRRY